MEYSEREIAKAVEIINHYNALQLKGERKAFPLPLYEAMYAATVQAADEAIIIDPKRTRYWLPRRPPNDKDFGPNKVHVLGGAGRPGPYSNPVENARWMARHELGLEDVKYIAGPIATYQWTQGGEHRVGWPRSEVRIFEIVGDARPDLDVPEYWIGNMPKLDDMINGRSGVIHLKFIKVFHAWLKNPNMPCVDLNIYWDRW